MTHYIKECNEGYGLKNLSKFSLLVLGVLLVANVQADETIKTGIQVSMISQPGARSEAAKELKSLEEEYIRDTLQALNKEDEGPDYSNEDIYVSHLVDVIEGNTQKGQPDFSSEDVYVNHLIDILM